MSPITFKEIFERLESGDGVDGEHLRRAFDAILAGDWTPSQIGGLLVAMRLTGETPEEVATAVEAMRAVMLPVTHEFDAVLDTAGTGGDGRGTVNLSTGAAIIAAASGIPVAKHGNRAVSSLAGSADVLEALGIPLDLSPDEARAAFAQAKAVFLMAPVHHPALRHVGPVRRELGIRTLFNALGPMGNPARATHQLLGAFDDALRPVFAQTLDRLGSRRAWVVRGLDGLDEVSPYTTTRVTELDRGTLRELEVTPEAFGLKRAEAGAADGGTAKENAAAMLEFLGGKPHPARDAFLLNGAAALVVAHGRTFVDAAAEATELVDSGAALETFERWKTASNAVRDARRG